MPNSSFRAGSITATPSSNASPRYEKIMNNFLGRLRLVRAERETLRPQTCQSIGTRNGLTACWVSGNAYTWTPKRPD